MPGATSSGTTRRKVPTTNNHVGSYRREITVPAGWKGKEIIAHFGSVTSNMYLWVNGKYVGYSEDSKLEAEFNLTPYLKPGQKNLIAFQVFRWCDGHVPGRPTSSATAVWGETAISTPATKNK